VDEDERRLAREHAPTIFLAAGMRGSACCSSAFTYR